jgi:hypothetical protein
VSAAFIRDDEEEEFFGENLKNIKNLSKPHTQKYE